MRLALVCVLAAACGSNGASAPADAAPKPKQLDLDITVSRMGVALYTNGSDFPGDCPDEFHFPKPGESASEDDEILCNPRESCLTSVAVEVGGRTIVDSGLPAGHVDFTGDFSDGDLMLDIVGCGGSAQVPLGPADGPVPTLTATEDTTAGSLTASWTSQPVASTALITFSAGLWADGAHVTGSSYTFTVPTGVPATAYRAAIVTTFAPVRTVDSNYGSVRVWTGETATTLLQ